MPAKTATPPTVPPAIAPVLVDFSELVITPPVVDEAEALAACAEEFGLLEEVEPELIPATPVVRLLVLLSTVELVVELDID